MTLSINSQADAQFDARRFEKNSRLVGEVAGLPVRHKCLQPKIWCESATGEYSKHGDRRGFPNRITVDVRKHLAVARPKTFDLLGPPPLR